MFNETDTTTQSSFLLLSSSRSTLSYLENIELKNFYLNIEKKLSILPIILTIFGTIGNLLAFYVLTRKKLRVYSTMLYFASLTIMDTISLYQWNFNFFYRYHINDRNSNLEEESLFLCRYVSFMAYFSLQTSAWILAIICVDRYLILVNNEWKRKISKSMKHTILIVVIIIAFIGAMNLPVVFLNGKVRTVTYNETISANETRVRSETETQCYRTPYMKFWEKVLLFNECLLPLGIMIVFNSLLIFKTHESSVKFKLLQQRRKTLLQKDKFSLQNIRSILTSANSTSAKPKLEKDNSELTLNYESSNHNHIQADETSAVHSKSHCLTPSNHSNSLANRIKFYSSPNLCSDANKRIDETTNHNICATNNGNGMLALPNSLKDKPKNHLTIPNSRHETSSLSIENTIDYIGHISCDTVFKADIQTTTKNEKKIRLQTYDDHQHRDKTSDEITKNEAENLMQTKADYQLPQRNGLGSGGSNAFLRAKEKKKKQNCNNTSRMSQIRNRKIILMLILLTSSFALSTFPSSIFFTFFRPIIRDKPYRRLLTLMSNLIKHLSHTFNFIIYFKYSSMIKQELNQILNIKKFNNYFYKKNFCLLKFFKCCKIFQNTSPSRSVNKKKTIKTTVNPFTINEKTIINNMDHHQHNPDHNNVSSMDDHDYGPFKLSLNEFEHDSSENQKVKVNKKTIL